MTKKILMITSILMLIAVFTQSCHVGRYFYWNFADANDFKKFPSVEIKAGSGVFNFDQPGKNYKLSIPLDYQIENEEQELLDFLENHQTLAFLIIRNDTILFEEYFSDYEDSSIIPSFSVSKVFVSALTGIAIEEGFIKSTNQAITDFIPELLENDSAFAEISIEDLLNMRSGIKFNEGYANPFADMAKYYYGRKLTHYISKLKIARPPDEEYEYISVNSLLLAMIIERSTNKPLNEYLTQKIWQPLGMEFDATWSIDSKKARQIKAFCCINARARDFAKFGRLYLNKGSWNEQQILPATWVEKSMTIINDSYDSQGYTYTYHWRVKEDGAIFAKGVLGQYIYVDPKKNVVIVRMGKKSSDLVWADFFEKLCEGL
ncbi:MAG: beta-lactamase family protein [Bacteroidales bacterium]|nr:beta-lactamase family protein [Bacteroidales bacterium]